MRRVPKKAYLVMWTRPTGRYGRKWYLRPHAIGPWIEKLARKSCTDVRVLEGDLRDVSSDFVPSYYDDDAVEKRLRWAGDSALRRRLLSDDPQIADWLMTHRTAERVLGTVESLTSGALRLRMTRTVRRRRH